MRDAVAWCLTRARTWVALLAATAATLLASGDGRAGWTVVVAVSTFALAFLSMRAHYLDTHPDLPDRRQARHDEMVERALRRYRGEPEPPRRRAERPARPAKQPKRAAEPPPTGWTWVFDRRAREARRQAKYDAWVEKTLRAYRERAAAEGAPVRRSHAARRARHGEDPAGGQPWLSP